MNRAPLIPDSTADVRAADRRLAVAVGASLLIHALVVASLKELVPPRPAQAPGLFNQFGTLQAVLAGPRIELPEPLPLELQAVPALLAPPQSEPLEALLRRAGFQAPSPAPGEAQPGAERQPVSIAIKSIDDPARLGVDYALTLGQRFPRRASKAPALLGSPAVSYPRAALEAGTNGRVAALVTLDPAGHVIDSTLLPEDGLFAPAVAEALKSARFAPAEIDGKPVPYWAIVEFYFSVARPSAALNDRPSIARRPSPASRQPSVGR